MADISHKIPISKWWSVTWIDITIHVRYSSIGIFLKTETHKETMHETTVHFWNFTSHNNRKHRELQKTKTECTSQNFRGMHFILFHTNKKLFWVSKTHKVIKKMDTFHYFLTEMWPWFWHSDGIVYTHLLCTHTAEWLFDTSPPVFIAPYSPSIVSYPSWES